MNLQFLRGDYALSRSYVLATILTERLQVRRMNTDLPGDGVSASGAMIPFVMTEIGPEQEILPKTWETVSLDLNVFPCENHLALDNSSLPLHVE